MQFTKMHGIRNDFIILNGIQHPVNEDALPALAQAMCDRRFGVGADGIVQVLPSESADLRMRMYNPDGSEAEMCGNGIRCFARYAVDTGLFHGDEMRVETAAGIKYIRFVGPNVQVNMGAPILDRADIPCTLPGDGPVISQELPLGNSSLAITCVSMGNPHAVILVDDVTLVNLETIGPAVETHPVFPRKTNVHVVQVIGPNEIRMRTWERGAGITLACGTGACASAVACHLNGRCDRSVLAHLPGGDLQLDWSVDGPVLMTGPAVTVFQGDWPD